MKFAFLIVFNTWVLQGLYNWVAKCFIIYFRLFSLNSILYDFYCVLFFKDILINVPQVHLITMKVSANKSNAVSKLSPWTVWNVHTETNTSWLMLSNIHINMWEIYSYRFVFFIIFLYLNIFNSAVKF